MKYIVTINDKNYEVEVEQGEAKVLAVTQAAAAPAAVSAAAAASAPAAAPPTVPAPAAPAAPGQPIIGDALPAPMPGVILNILKKEGDVVKSGDIVLIMEAMKMENEIVATRGGMITKVFVAKGATVTTGDPLVAVG